MRKKKEISLRWSNTLIEQINEKIAKSVKQSSSRTGNLPSSPFGFLSSGQEDYRGFVLREALSRAQLESIDLTGFTCEWAGALIDCTMRDCGFDCAKMEGRFVGKYAERCKFVSASLRDAALGGRFIECDFSKANLSRAHARGIEFLRCNFNGTDLRAALFLNCRFDQCFFESAKFHNGSLGGSIFVGQSIPDSQLGNTIIDGVKVIE